jgi:Na+/H+ antiporter NhaC
MWIVVLAAVAGFQVQPSRDYQVGGVAKTSVTVTAVDGAGKPVAIDGPVAITGLADHTGAAVSSAQLSGGIVTLDEVAITGDVTVTSADGAVTGGTTVRQLPGWLSLLPPLFAILLAVWLRQALIALFAGIWIGALVIHGFNPLTALLTCFDTYLPQQVGDVGNAKVLLFTLALGGMVGIVARSGGSKAMVELVAKRARTRRSGMLATAISGVVVFFDDYANCLLVGNTVRPFTDSRQISREKLSFLVDSTAAPISTIALVSTWTGYQLGQLENAGVGLEGKSYDFFLTMLPYSFYSIFTLFFVFAVAASMRDFGPMLRAERRALHKGQLLRPGAVPLQDTELTDLEPPPGKPLRWQNGLFPIGFVIVGVMVGLYISGKDELGAAADGAGLREIISAADSPNVLLWASFGGGVVALATSLSLGTLRLGEVMDSWVGGVKAMVMACLILTLAWGIGDICKNYLFTGPWLLSQVTPSPHWMPLITFVISGLIAFATGSSFSTMGIVIPIAAPMIWAITGDGDPVRAATLAAVLSGAVFGDHCSPISDTTIMASMSSAADHIDHVRTQVPYALTCAGVAAVAGYVPAGFGWSPWVSIPIGFAGLAALVLLLGRRADDGPPHA